jgi:hypothetical protein
MREAADLGLELQDIIEVLKQCKNNSQDDLPTSDNLITPENP